MHPTVTPAEVTAAKRALVALWAQVPAQVAREVGAALHPLVRLAEQASSGRGAPLQESGQAQPAPDAVRAALLLAADAISTHAQGWWWQDGDLRDHLLEHGLVECVTVAEPCGSRWCACEPGDTCHRVSRVGQRVQVAAAVMPAMPVPAGAVPAVPAVPGAAGAAGAVPVPDALRAAVLLAVDAISAHVQGRWWQDADLQDHLLERGLLEPHTVTEPCGGEDCACEPGDTCHRVSVLGADLQVVAAALAAQDGAGGTDG
jgi:hypothetical protein